MMKPTVLSIFLLSFLVVISVSSAEQMKIPGTQIDPVELTQHFGQTFHITRERMLNKESSYGEQGWEGTQVFKFNYVSTRPYRKDKNGEIYLKFSLTVTIFKEQAQAISWLKNVAQKAHPDMGITYEWDLFFVKKSTLYHLHMPCIFSEANVNLLSTTLEKMVQDQGITDLSQLKCRCGGGCK